MKGNTKATWIWYPGDFEIWQHQKKCLSRKERLTTVPAFWRVDTFYSSVIFRKELCLMQPEKIKVLVEGEFHLEVDGYRLRNEKDEIVIPAGEHTVRIAVANTQSIPAIYIMGDTIVTDSSWEVSCYDGKWKYAGKWNFNHENSRPSNFKLSQQIIFPLFTKKEENEIFLDFGKEICARIKLEGITGSSPIKIYYGESIEEAKSEKHCVQMDECIVMEEMNEYIGLLKAFRYVVLNYEDNIEITQIAAISEYLPLKERGFFHCSNEKMNQIWETAKYTLHLNTREFFLDGIKRDGWVWSGDAYQSYLMNYYCFFDKDVCKRTLIALRGKDPVSMHINTIMDYTFYWFIGIYDYYMYTADREFIMQIYPSMLTLMDFCLGRVNENGMLEGKEGDWIFIDWADMIKEGEVSAEQILFCKSLEIISKLACILNDKVNDMKFAELAKKLQSKLIDAFWNEGFGGLVTSRINGASSNVITKHANIFALIFGLLDEEKRESVINRILLNDSMQKIKTPYFRFFELASLCEAGKYSYVVEEILSYWGSMLDLGATTFWEEYDPTMCGTEHYAMYGEPFDKSLCHAWGASPIYILGKYYLGVSPILPGFDMYEIKPNLGSLSMIQGKVPMPGGEVEVFMDQTVIKICSTSNVGILRFESVTEPKLNKGKVVSLGKHRYEVVIDELNFEYVVYYGK